MIPSVFSFGGGGVSNEVMIITVMQKSHAASARWLKVLKRPSNSNSASAPEKIKPNTIVVTAALAFARFHKMPTVNTTANGGAMKKKTVLIFSKSVVEVSVKVIAIQMLASKTNAPLHRPNRTCCASVAL